MEREVAGVIWNGLLNMESAPAVACNWNVPVVFMLRLLKVATPSLPVGRVVVPIRPALLAGSVSVTLTAATGFPALSASLTATVMGAPAGVFTGCCTKARLLAPPLTLERLKLAE